jgi:hypothetical protein
MVNETEKHFFLAALEAFPNYTPNKTKNFMMINGYNLSRDKF